MLVNLLNRRINKLRVNETISFQLRRRSIERNFKPLRDHLPIRLLVYPFPMRNTRTIILSKKIFKFSRRNDDSLSAKDGSMKQGSGNRLSWQRGGWRRRTSIPKLPFGVTSSSAMHQVIVQSWRCSRPLTTGRKIFLYHCR